MVREKCEMKYLRAMPLEKQKLCLAASVCLSVCLCVCVFVYVYVSVCPYKKWETTDQKLMSW